jgi:hypothetical protein
MELALFIYLSGITESLRGFLSITGGVAGIASVFLAVAWAISAAESINETIKNGIKKAFKWAISVALVFGFLGALIPSQKTMWMMAAGYAGQEIATNKATQETVKKLNDVIQGKLDLILSDMNKELAKTK